MAKIKMTTPIVEMDGDEMTRILWKMIKEHLLNPFIELNTDYYDLGLEHRNETNDQVTFDSAEATKKYKVAVKCATITPNAARMPEYNLKEMWKSPNGTIRAILDGTVFRAPIVVKGIEPCVKNWKKPITIARHAYGDVYKNTEIKVPGPGKVELVYTGDDGTQIKELVHKYDGPGVAQGIHNLCGSIESFARSCFNYALDTKQDLWFATKDTISKKYDHTFKDIFQDIFDAEYKEKFDEAGIEYFYTLIDDAVARVMKSEGGYIWACKNYDGVVMSDTIVVMNQGYIQQVGTPEDIYNEPKNAFVADFIGDSNILSATMVHDRLVNILGANFPCVDEGFGQKKPVDAVIRPEDIDLVKPEDGIIRGVVTHVIFKGVHYEMEVMANNYEWLVHSTDMFPVGAEVGLRVDPFDIQIMKKPESEDEEAVPIEE